MTFTRRAIAFAGLSLAPNIVLAHTPIKGMNHFVNGFLHPVFVPAHLILLLAIGLLLGQQGPNRNVAALMIYPIVTVIGLIASEFPIVVKPEIAILSGAMMIGLLIAVSPRLSLLWCSISAAFAGLAISLDSSQPSLSGMSKISTLIGTGLGMVLVPVLAMEFADYFRSKTWQRISIRILGSWIAASAFLVLAVTFSSGKL
jgi:hydrogenase/urease accessory protein HupE